MVLGLVLTGCSSADDILKAAARQADNADDLAKSKYRPPRYEGSPLPPLPTQAEIEAATRSLASSVDDVPTDDAWIVVDYSCQGVEIAEAAAGDAEDAVEWAVTQSETAASYRIKVESLVEDLMATNTAGDFALVLGRAALCQAASEHR